MTDNRRLNVITFEWYAKAGESVGFLLDMVGNGFAIIDWGDGCDDFVEGYNKKECQINHKYEAGDIYNVRVTITRYYYISFEVGVKKSGNILSINTTLAPDLYDFSIINSDIEEIDLSRNINLESVYFSDNLRLENLDFSNNKNIVVLNCSENNLTSLNITHNNKLEILDCSYNKLEKLDISNNEKLTYISMEGNKAESIYQLCKLDTKEILE